MWINYLGLIGLWCTVKCSDTAPKEATCRLDYGNKIYKNVRNERY